MGTASHTALAHVDRLLVDVRTVPRGRKGLMRALAASVGGPAAPPALPVLDSGGLGCGRSMFDYDPALAAALDA